MKILTTPDSISMNKVIRTLKEKSAYSLAYYHKNKHKRGIKDLVRKTKEEKRAVQREGERRRYREQAVAEGRSVREYDPGHVKRTPEQARAANNLASQRYRERNPEKRRLSAKEWAERNRGSGLRRFRERYHSEPEFNLSIKVRRRIYMAVRSAFNGKGKRDRIINLLGCAYTELKTHIESQFTEGMTWDDCFNGRIHLDHIRPCVSFDLTDPEEQKKCFHYTNLQPLWAADNLKKHAKWEEEKVA